MRPLIPPQVPLRIHILHINLIHVILAFLPQLQLTLPLRIPYLPLTITFILLNIHLPVGHVQTGVITHILWGRVLPDLA